MRALVDKTGGIRYRGTLRLGLVLLLGLLAVGCSDSTAPGGGGNNIEISFAPAAQGQEIDLTETIDFSISAPDAKTVNVNWKMHGIVISQAHSYTYRPIVLGTDTLRVQVAADGNARNYYWVIETVAVSSTLPPEVLSVSSSPGPEPGDVHVSWNRVENSTYPIAEYQVAVSATSAITDANWDEARLLRQVPNQVGQVSYLENFTVADDGMVPGESIWLAVRAVDQAGQMSPVGGNTFTTVTTSWWLNGTVSDGTGAIPSYVVVKSIAPSLSTNIDAVTGRFSLGPFRSVDEISVYTRSSTEQGSGWFDFQSTALDSIDGKDYEIVLIKRHTLDEACDGYTGQFLNYLRFMAKTQHSQNNPDNTKLRKWETYPVKVYLPDPPSVDGVDFAAASQFAMAFWDSVMGEPYFEEVDNPDVADVVINVEDRGSVLYGQVNLLEPSPQLYALGDVIPEKVEVYLWTGIADVPNPMAGAKAVAMHEFGHVLGLLAHSGCAESGHLMVVGGTGYLTNEHPIHTDEQNAVRCIRLLPQNVDTASYSLTEINPPD